MLADPLEAVILVSPLSIAGALRERFSEAEAAYLTVVIASINAWNRIAGGLRFAPAIPNKG